MWILFGSITVSNPATNDVGVTALIKPNTIECLTSTQNFTVRITNFGSATQTSVPVDVSVSGANVGSLSGTYTGSIPTCSFADYTFASTINMSNVGLNTINAYTSLTTDANSTNDNFNTTRTKTAGTALAYVQNFNTFVAPAGFVGNFLYNGAPQHGTGASGGMFFNLWSNATTCNVTTPKFAAGNAGTELTFDYRLVNWSAYANPGGTATSISNMDSINVLVSNNCGVSYTRIYSINGSNHTASNLFKNISIPLGAYSGQELIFKFEGKWSTGDYYIDIDNLNITLPLPIDAGVQMLLSPTPTSGCPSASTQVKVRIKNYGNNNISNVPVRVDITGPIPAVLNATYTGTITPAGTFDFVVGNADLSAVGTYTITAKTIYAGDPNNANDSFLPAINVTTTLPQGFTYFQDFNTPGAPAGLTGNMNYNTGFAPFHGTAASGGMSFNLWTNLPNRFCSTTLPKLGNLNAVSEISFDYRIVNSAGYANPGGTATVLGVNDSINVLLSTDCGASFIQIYTINSVTHTTANTFKNILLSLGAFDGKTAIIKFEGKWGAGNYFIDIDNINVTIPLPNDAGIVAVTEPNISTGCPDVATPIKVRIKNFGISKLVNVPVRVNVVGAATLQIDGVYTDTILPGNSVDFVVGNADLSAPGFYFFYAKTMYPGDPNSTNDSILTPPSVSNAITYPIPYSENFNAFGAPAGYTGNMSYFAGGTGHGTGGSGGMFFNLNSFAGNSVVTLPKIGRFNNDAVLSFDYRLVDFSPYANPGGFQYTAKLTDSINIYASSDCGYTFELIYSINGSNHNLTNTFRNIRIPLTKFGGKNVIFRFNGKWGGNGNFYIDMDNINIKNDTNDFLISSIVTPMSNTCYKTGEIKVVIKNNGTIGKANIPVKAVLSGALNASFNYNYSSYLGVGQEDTIVIGTMNSTAGGMTMIQVFTDEKREDMRGNDTSSATFFNTSPVVITPDTNNYCEGGSSVLTASGSNAYKWWDGQTINPININPTSSITVWAEGIDLNNCVDTGYKNIVVYPNPTVGIVNDTICLNQYGTIRATGGVSYNWGAFGVKSAVSHNPTTNTQYDVTVTNAFKCSATGTATIDVKPLPVYTIINDSQCMNNVATISATGGVSYNWGVYGNSNSVVTNKLIKTLTFPVVITGANGCTVTDMATAYMRPGPNVTITNATICVGSGAQVSAAGGVQYNWGVYGKCCNSQFGRTD
ncbi:MAG: hypothetical protein IPK03_10995 [Bacteroidetes bacterium]|nr:hypothetical protein [Bacteroidota bacterium]